MRRFGTLAICWLWLVRAWPGAAHEPAGGRGLLSRQEDRPGHRLFAGRHLRSLCARSSRAISATTFPASRLIVPRNMPGAGSRTAAELGLQRRAEGRHRAGHRRPVAAARAGARRQAASSSTRTKFIYIGNPNVENNTTVTWHTSGIKTIEDAKKTRGRPWAPPAARPSSQYPKAMNALLGTKFKIILGYPGGNDINLAMERGEVDGRGSQHLGVVEGDAAGLAARQEDQHPGSDRA